MTDRMTVGRLGRILDAHGGQWQRWPDSERDAALALVAEDPAAAALLDQARALDSVLDSYVVPAPSPDLMAAILSRTQGPGWAVRLGEIFGLPRFTWRPAAGLVAAGIVGLTLGAVDLSTLTGEEAPSAGAEAGTGNAADNATDADWLTFALADGELVETDL